MNEEEKTARARKQLALVGAVCIALVVFTLWLTNLPTILAYNRQNHPSAFSLFGSATNSLGQAWSNVTQSFTSLQK